MNILFTGFEPFGELDYNPSWDAASAAAQAYGGAAELLPVTFEVARDVLEQSRNFDAVVHFGVAVKRDAPCLERYARNVRGVEGGGVEAIEEDGPAVIECALRLDAFAQRLNDASPLGWSVSEDAGTYVCNATLYHALRELGPTRAMFVHLPMSTVSVARTFGVMLGATLAILPQKWPESLHC